MLDSERDEFHKIADNLEESSKKFVDALKHHTDGVDDLQVAINHAWFYSGAMIGWASKIRNIIGE